MESRFCIFNTLILQIWHMKIIFISLLSIIYYCSFAQITVTEIGSIPKKTSNNVVCEGFINGNPYIYSFGGIDSTKLYSGIHQNSYRYDVTNDETMAIPNLPDTLGKNSNGCIKNR